MSTSPTGEQTAGVFVPTDRDLPDAVAAMWGRRVPPRRGPRPRLTIEEIVGAALRIADAEGLAAVSIARVAAEVGNSKMALYRHIGSKEDLHLLMADAALDLPPADPPTGRWRDQLVRWAEDVLGMMLRRPWYRELPLTSPPLGPRNLKWLERALVAFTGTGLPEDDMLRVVNGLLPLVHGQARLAVDFSGSYADDPSAFGSGYQQTLSDLLDPVEYPTLSRVVGSAAFERQGNRAGADDAVLDGEFHFALERYLDGVAAFFSL